MSYATYSHNGATTATTGSWIDITPATQSDSPPVLIVSITVGTATVLIEGSHDLTSVFDFSNGGVTASCAKDLIPGVRFWRTRITAIGGGGVVSSMVGPVPTSDGGYALPGNLTVSSGGPVT